jgi:hypothetical protein
VSYPDPREVSEAYLRWKSGERDSDEEAASDLLWLYEMRNVTHPVGVEMARIKGAAWLEKAVDAAQDDPDFFRRLATILEARKRFPKERSAVAFVFSAYLRLTQYPLHNPREVTKKTVRVLAMKLWAFSNLVERKKLSGDYTDELTPGQKAILQEEIDRLPKQRWQDLWPILALENLPGSKRGPNSID